MGLRRQQVISQLVRLLGLPPGREEKVARYYHELETGLLDPRGVQPFVWHNLAKIFGTGIRGLMVDQPEPPPVLVAAYYRVSDDLASADAPPVPRPPVERKSATKWACSLQAAPNRKIRDCSKSTSRTYMHHERYLGALVAELLGPVRPSPRSPQRIERVE
jgi:hypothetical protein